MSKKVWQKLYPKHIQSEIVIPDLSLPDMLQETVKKYPNHSAIYFYGREMSYTELGQLTDKFGAALQEKGIKKGDRIAIMLPNSPQYIISYYGILKTGGIVTQVNPMYTPTELEYILNDSEAKAIVIYEPLLPVLEQVIHKTSVELVIKVNLQGAASEDEVSIDFNDFLYKAKGSILDIDIQPNEDVAVLQYTGGTTGRSKGAMLTHRNLYANVLQCYEFFKDFINPGEDRKLSVIPFFHVYGMTSCINLTILTGSTNIILPRFDVDEVLETIKNAKPNSFPGVPTMYIALLNHPKAKEYGIDSIKVVNSGSAPMPVEVMRSFEEQTGSKILEGYGLSEASPTTHCNPIFGSRKPGSVGIGIPNTDYKIVDLATGTQELKPGEIGELIIKGPQVMKGYWNMPEETINTIRDGWLYTGDIAYMDDEGYLYIVDRKKDMIIASGYNVYPREVEEVLYEHPAIKEAVVIGIPDAYRGENVKAVIVLKEKTKLSENELIEYCREKLAPYKVPRVVEFREELPKTSVGKILRRRIREESLQNSQKDL
ncbi:long-chain fatty acid--CoA ligase [Caldibacillus thermolactis]|jgi:long-chain acyl-CoA synthetase|uniref:Long-chain fatty acid--CoA ligase n=1 Tax=Pallidibacillus thermolactis TaxID=251051 RepID=A0ABT2WE88_9BACI|nr:long-chain fatty acid--CoA ligase [Pallidibacillus thermolactis]MCU9593992.1 long-chain fatty acid--CoA ligase [Pallidibacillus thermolactis]MCU9600769.1 long-chain fatty acid--CoA ligase [Pallidibacillus thermolactis subsp. kokeshiiformis]